MYSTLIGLLAARQPELGSQIVASMSARLQACLGQSDFFRSRLLVRSFADLCAAGVVTAESAIAILRSCLAVTTERDSPQVRKDAYAELVMAAMPWIGPLLAERLTGSLDEFLEGIDSYLKSVPSQSPLVACSPSPASCIVIHLLLKRPNHSNHCGPSPSQPQPQDKAPGPRAAAGGSGRRPHAAGRCSGQPLEPAQEPPRAQVEGGGYSARLPRLCRRLSRHYAAGWPQPPIHSSIAPHR